MIIFNWICPLFWFPLTLGQRVVHQEPFLEMKALIFTRLPQFWTKFTKTLQHCRIAIGLFPFSVSGTLILLIFKVFDETTLF
ncbi:unnamed protein product [Brassica oleracea]